MLGLTIAEVCPMLKYFTYQLVENLKEIPSEGVMGETTVINCLNPHSFMMATRDSDFSEALRQSNYLLPDGEGICMTMRWFSSRKIGKIAGDDLHRFLLAKTEAAKGRVFYMGSSEMVLQRIASRICQEYPNIEVQTLSPSFCNQLPEAESLSIVETINGFRPDVLFVSMTAPKQEKWLHRYKGALKGVGVAAGIGAVFDFYAGTVKRAPAWAVRMKLEWLVRLLKEPRRMWRRNMVSTPQFLWWVFRHRKEI